VLRLPCGGKYVGHFRDGLKDGQGTFSYSNGERYVGQFKNDKRDGKGIYYYSDGSSYEGFFLKRTKDMVREFILFLMGRSLKGCLRVKLN